MKSKTTAGILALLLGGLGVHKFYLDRTGQGLLYLLFSWTFIPALISFFEAFRYFLMSDQKFNRKYNAFYQNPVSFHTPQQNNVNISVNSIAEEIEKAKNMKDRGIITEEEFEKIKAKILK